MSQLIQGQLDLLTTSLDDLEKIPVEIDRCSEIEDVIRFALGIIWQMDKRGAMNSPPSGDSDLCDFYRRILEVADRIEKIINNFKSRDCIVSIAEQLREQCERVEALLDCADSEQALADDSETIPYEEVRRELGLT